MFENHKPVLITTQHRGVFFGYVGNDTDLTQRTLTDIKGARMAIYWGTEKGVMQLADTGPTRDSLSAHRQPSKFSTISPVFSPSPTRLPKNG